MSFNKVFRFTVDLMGNEFIRVALVRLRRMERGVTGMAMVKGQELQTLVIIEV